jgi:hypothetical protein
MNKLAAFIALSVLLIGGHVHADCGLTTRHCRKVVVQSAVVQKFVSVVPAAVTFVPSQVLLNGQVTYYNQGSTSVSGLGYSYQGAVAQPQQPQQADQQTRLSDNDRITVIEKKLDILLKSLNVESEVVAEAENVPADPDNQGLTWKQVFASSCLKCHGATPANNEFSMVNESGEFVDKLSRYNIYERLTLPLEDPRHMPKGKMLPDDHLEVVRRWVNSGLKDLKY